MTFTVIVSLRFVIVNLESILRMSFIVDNLVLSISVYIRIITFHMTVTIRYLMPFLRILVIARSIPKLVATWPMKSLYIFFAVGRIILFRLVVKIGDENSMKPIC